MDKVNKVEGPAIGIDLGTTCSCVAVVRNGKVEVIANELGHFTTPSFVTFNEVERLVGDAAKEEISSNAANTVFDVKRLIGRQFNDPVVQKDIQQWPFDVIDVNEMPKVRVTYKNEVKQFAAEEISAMVLGKMKEIAESYLNATVKNAVVTVPAYFNDMQRKATIDAATIAGLNVSQIINEPTAAAIAYGLKNDTKDARNVLVYDLGGGTFDVSILNIWGDSYAVKATGGDTHLGGEDFDHILMETFAAEFERKNNVDIAGDKKALRRLRTACELAKRRLSAATQAPIRIESLYGGIDFVTVLTRARFDQLCESLFNITIKIVKATLKDAALKCDDIDTIVLVGGSTRIPKIQQLLHKLFDGKEISKTINPDEAVAYGAAIQAAKMHGGGSVQMEKMKLIDVTPLTLGIGIIVRRGHDVSTEMYPIIERNTPIPVARSKTGRVPIDCDILTIDVLQGEHTLAQDNLEIGRFEISLLPVHRGKLMTNTFTIDANGILTVISVCESKIEASGSITITNVCGSLTKEEIEKMITEAKQHRHQELESYHTARLDLEKYCNETKNQHEGKRNFVREKCDEVLLWLDSCCSPTLAQFHEMKNELKSVISIDAAKRPKNENDVIEIGSVSDPVFEIDD